MIKENILTENGSLELTYEINVTFHGDLKFYGITITSKDMYGITESKEIKDISSDRKSIENLIDEMRSGKVTPATFEDIISDFINN